MWIISFRWYAIMKHVILLPLPVIFIFMVSISCNIRLLIMRLVMRKKCLCCSFEKWTNFYKTENTSNPSTKTFYLNNNTFYYSIFFPNVKLCNYKINRNPANCGIFTFVIETQLESEKHLLLVGTKTESCWKWVKGLMEWMK